MKNGVEHFQLLFAASTRTLLPGLMEGKQVRVEEAKRSVGEIVI